MDMFVNYAPVIVVVLMFLLHERIVVTPEQLEKKHREILEDVENRFASLSTVKDLKEQVSIFFISGKYSSAICFLFSSATKLIKFMIV